MEGFFQHDELLQAEGAIVACLEGETDVPRCEARKALRGEQDLEIALNLGVQADVGRSMSAALLGGGRSVTRSRAQTEAVLEHAHVKLTLN